jgi:DNA-binding transcriptional LysR family regulator
MLLAPDPSSAWVCFDGPVTHGFGDWHDPLPAGEHHEASAADVDSPLPTGLDPRALLVFREVGRLGSMTAAAEALGWTQPAVSQHVRRLERRLGLPLVVREGRGTSLTDAGAALVRRADALALALRDAEHDMVDRASLRSGRVRMTAFPSASARLVAAAIRGLTEEYPGVDVRLDQLEPPEAQAALDRGECDVAVVFDHEDDALPGPDAVPLLEDPLLLVLPAGHRLAGAPRLTLADLAGDAWVAGCPRCRSHLTRRADRAGFVPDVRHSTDDYVVVQALVAAGLAVALLPALALAAHRHPGVVAVPVDLPPRRVGALTRPATRAAPAVAAAVRHLARAARAEAAR